MQANHRKYVEQAEHVQSFYLSLIQKISFKTHSNSEPKESEAWGCIPSLCVDNLGVG
jgi:hypothetical protein